MGNCTETGAEQLLAALSDYHPQHYTDWRGRPAVSATRDQLLVVAVRDSGEWLLSCRVMYDHDKSILRSQRWYKTARGAARKASGFLGGSQ